MNSLNNEHSLFLTLRDMVFLKSKWQLVQYSLFELFPESFIKNFKSSRSGVWPIMKEIFDNIRKQRLDNLMEKRNDFINLLLELGKEGKLYGEELGMGENGRKRQIEIDFNENRMIAQLFIYFVAGFETASTTMSYAMHELAFHPEIQQEVQKEIDTVLAKHKNEFSYEAITEMHLLESVIKESLRLFPPAGVTHRMCTKDYIIPEVNVKI
ncbi:unnamed protein product [Leptosia nina]|uniref:unspecific monooxygenase n=1 Tax=Leptosia nina TaxID=320188 RepID=A0AAV1J941_9NEOP